MVTCTYGSNVKKSIQCPLVYLSPLPMFDVKKYCWKFMATCRTKKSCVIQCSIPSSTPQHVSCQKFTALLHNTQKLQQTPTTITPVHFFDSFGIVDKFVNSSLITEKEYLYSSNASIKEAYTVLPALRVEC